MRVGTILLSNDNEYLMADGSLPDRPSWDKQLLADLVSHNGLVSSKGYNLLPPSIQANANIAEYGASTDFMPITIKELNTCNLLIVSRSKTIRTNKTKGKIFRLDNFKLLIKTKGIELWISI